MRLIISTAIITILLACDQITKFASLHYFEDAPMAVTPFFNFVIVYNTGVSFGMGKGSVSPYALAGLSALIALILIIWLIRTPRKDLSIALSMIIAGAIGNIIDRFVHGAVIDFLDFHAFGWHYPAFNIADSAIVLGIAFLLFDSLFLEAKKQKQSDDKNEHD